MSGRSDVDRVLAGELGYNDLGGAAERAEVRAEWQHRLPEGVAGIDMLPDLAARGGRWYGADEQGHVYAEWAGEDGALQREYVSPDDRRSAAGAP